MNKKRILIAVSVFAMLLVLTACTVPTNADGSVKLITLETPWKETFSEDIFSAVLTWPLAQAINWLSYNTNSVGLGVAIVTILLNAIILAFTYKSNVAMQKMQALQPELQKIQKKYEGKTDNMSKQKQAQEMQLLYQKHGVNPLGSLAATFIQLPVLFAMFSAVRRSAAVAYGDFLGVSLATTPKEGFASLAEYGPTKEAFVIIGLYVLMILLQFISIRLPQLLAERKAKKEAELHHKHYEKAPNQNALMTYGMLIFISFIMLSWQSAMSLYYCIFSLINIGKTLFIDKMNNRSKEAE